jgi:hypothetical protein
MGICAVDSATLGAIRPDWIETGRINVLVQAGLEVNPNIKAPPIWNYIQGENRAVAELIVGQQEFGRPFLAPPGTPAAQMSLLRSAFMAAMKDPELIEDADKMKLSLNPKGGEEIAAVIRKMYASSPELIDRAKNALRP